MRRGYGAGAVKEGSTPIQTTGLSRYDRIMLPVAYKLQDFLAWLEKLGCRKS